MHSADDLVPTIHGGSGHIASLHTEETQVRVLPNGSALNGWTPFARQTDRQLRTRGWPVAGVGNPTISVAYTDMQRTPPVLVLGRDQAGWLTRSPKLLLAQPIEIKLRFMVGDLVRVAGCRPGSSALGGRHRRNAALDEMLVEGVLARFLLQKRLPPADLTTASCGRQSLVVGPDIVPLVDD